MFQSFTVFENSIDSVQLASNEISWSGSFRDFPRPNLGPNISHFPSEIYPETLTHHLKKTFTNWCISFPIS